ncbi:helix-turn-helix transcriptional regulator [Trichlorobacter lovleyi]|uniref:helix-turn-helix domain-containing protein n=1 Tax=Trichlorobacter lovleyi TaxID=313985 RepID=UPI0022405EF0|nr:helix-turn-helix transcriptional regulator [Trichlorobacter lovleyi]QOX79827.1 helix-turn-helix transcriptional regulator [Trichlorobacter lovleyi]
MTYPDAMQLLKAKREELGQNEVARILGCSPATISRIVNDDYPNPEHILRRVIETFGGLFVTCPVLEDIPLSRCADERKKPFAAVNHQAVRLWKACQSCEQNR